MARAYELLVREEAEDDLASALLWYAINHPHRSQRFIKAVDECFLFILRNPDGPVRIDRGYHQFPLMGFPYFVVYRVEGNEVVIARVFHMKRDPRTKLRRKR